ncbi:MAG: YgjP-like metallopeptidase domain-containing protein [Pseudomonadota bacterium]
MSPLPHEKTYVEIPFIEQLKQMGWAHIEGDIDVPYLTERESFRDVLLTGRLRAALKTINIDAAGKPWLDDDRIDQVVGRLERISAPKLMEANREVFDLIVGGVEVGGDAGALHDRDRTAAVIDFENPARNDFLAVSQFRVEVPGGKHFIVPDIVLFVNGIPMVVVECKSPKLTNPMEEGINQLLRYSNQRPEVEEDEGCERLFYHNQFMISTFKQKARAATVGAGYEQYMEWKDTSPVPMSKVAGSLDKHLREDSSNVVFTMVQKYQEKAPDTDDYEIPKPRMLKAAAPSGKKPGKHKLPAKPILFPVWNSSEKILVLVDEAHRSHTSMLHANMMQALPNCAKIGFTGTPIIAGRSKKRTHEIFGDYIDQYTIEQSQKDGATVKILYEGRKAEAAVEDGQALEMEHAVKYYIEKHHQEDPAFYKKLSERLKAILDAFCDNWDTLAEELRKFIREARKGREEDQTGLDPKTQAPFLGILIEEYDKKPDEQTMKSFCEAVVDMVDHIRQEIRVVDFWRSRHAQDMLRLWIINEVDDLNLIPFENQEKLADRFMELAKALRLWQGYFELLESEKSKGREHFVFWYRKQLKRQLKGRIPRYDKRIGVAVKGFRILDLGHRWASCGRNGVISFNWRSIMAPIWVFDYILVHEMVHKIERRHSKKFWSLVSRVIPDYEEHARWLNENGANLDL